jgi:DNA-binding transcriptional ArsR family regulator
MSATDVIIDELVLGRQRYAMGETVVALMEGFRRDYMPKVEICEAFVMLLILRKMLEVHIRGQNASASAISRAVNMSRTTVRRKLGLLEELGAVEKIGSRFRVLPTYMNSPHMVRGFRKRRDIMRQAPKRMAETDS